ncbi:uncharacterized protein VTP21DRAFT_6879 [Calcarisporiella thermophila]|uniref:uncharacterized protein n=1 Tax=Calcarisporiella thermophila TaxID=911321 RepID=UPI0037448BB1
MARPASQIVSQQEWRMKERLKTVSVLILICLNIGVDPPDIVKTHPCAKLECWFDPESTARGKAMEEIAKRLQSQYEALQPRARYRLGLDPSVEDARKLCQQLRRNAKDERVLFHYNGHGVPKPTTSGEIWLFNKNFTQYIPVSLYDIQGWLGAPCIYVYDCSAAGNILLSFNKFAEQRDQEAQRAAARNAYSSSTSSQQPPQLQQQQQPQLHPQQQQQPQQQQPQPYHPHHRQNQPQQNGGNIPHAPFPSMNDSIQLAACGPNEILPMHPDMPADMFTCCLTTPIEIAVTYFVLQNPLKLTNLSLAKVRKIPGRTDDRRTPLGELNWIFTAITDTIAWNVLRDEPELFKRLFRQDLMVAGLFRNFLLANRIMRTYKCTPMSSPVLPPTHNHPLWDAWDLAVDMVLAQMPALLEAEANAIQPLPYKNSNFFEDQLTAFDVWLRKGAVTRQPPEQLPIVLQVLLSQVHRVRALVLLSKFLDLGPWAVHLALSVGIFPYVLKLLQSPAADLKPVLVFIWSRVLAVDRSCQMDLHKGNGFLYFVNILSPKHNLPLPNVADHQAMCAFILSVFCTDFPPGQQACLKNNVMGFCVEHIGHHDPLLKQWACLLLGQLWRHHPEAKWTAIRDNTHVRLLECLATPENVPEVRASILYALTTFIGDLDKTEQVVDIERMIAVTALVATNDQSPVVRRELVILLSAIVHEYLPKFILAAYELTEEDRQRAEDQRSKQQQHPQQQGQPPQQQRRERRRISDGVFRSQGHHSTIYGSIWKALLTLSVDPHPEVRESATKIVDYVHYQLICQPPSESIVSSLYQLVNSAPSSTPTLANTPSTTSVASAVGGGGSVGGAGAVGGGRPALPPNERSLSFHGTAGGSGADPVTTAASRVASTLRRSASFVFKNLYSHSNGDTSSMDEHHHPERAHTPPPVSLKRVGTAPSSGRISPVPTPLEGSRGGSSTVSTDGGENWESLRLPLKSEFFEWSCEFFTEPQIQPSESDEPGSITYNERLWRRNRNEKIIAQTQTIKESAGASAWDRTLRTMGVDIIPSKMTFHQFEPHLIFADNQHTLSVYNWEDGTHLNYFANGNPPRSHISSIRLINEEDIAMLMAGSSDGVVRMYKHYDRMGQAELVTAWRALPEMTPASPGVGLVMEWQQRGVLFVAGDAKAIKIWDAARELCISDVHTRSGSFVTSLSSDQMGGNIFVAGFADGAIRVYDRRMDPRECMVWQWKEHKSPVINVSMQQDGNRELVSGGAAGDVRVWDVRMESSVHTWEAHMSSLSAIAAHPSAPVISTGSQHLVKVWNTSGTQLSILRQHTGFLGQRIGPVTALAFHPHKAVLAAAGGGDHYVTIQCPHISEDGKRA